MTPKIVGLTGLAAAGKSTVAEHLVEKHGFTKLSFAGPLKKMLRTLDPEMTNTSRKTPVRLSEALRHYKTEAALKKSPWGPEYRRLLQVLGTDCIRAVDKDFWVRAGLAQITDWNGRYVFDDVRFPNEANALKRVTRARGFAEGTLWNVVRPSSEDTGFAKHESERHAGNLGEDYVIVNDGDLSNLRLQTDLALGATL